VLGGCRWRLALLEHRAQFVDDLFDVAEGVGVAREPLVGHGTDGPPVAESSPERRTRSSHLWRVLTPYGFLHHPISPDCLAGIGCREGLAVREF
jgi:hypothetical protein